MVYFHLIPTELGSGKTDKQDSAVKYDSSTGKVYAELGCTKPSATSPVADYGSSGCFGSASPSGAYSAYATASTTPVTSSSQNQYMSGGASSFGNSPSNGNSSSTYQFNPYDR